jgi:NAD(P)-dependent dehydrogenase (short-subunit alcohol dehydrogenase family)
MTNEITHVQASKIEIMKTNETTRIKNPGNCKLNRKFSGKVAIVTGSSRGIGRTIARHLGEAGASVILNGTNREHLMGTCESFAKEGLRVRAYHADVSLMEDCHRLVSQVIREFGRIDILINNTGLGSRGLFENTSPEVFKRLFNVNVIGSVYPTIAALPYIKCSHGSILFISSLAGLQGVPNICPYSMTKMAQTSLAESLRTELYGEGVHVGIVYAGKTENDPEKRILFQDGNYKGVKKAKPMFVDSQDEVAKTVLRTIYKRHFKSTVGAKGRTYYWVQKFMPWLLDLTFRKNLDLIKNDET